MKAKFTLGSLVSVKNLKGYYTVQSVKYDEEHNTFIYNLSERPDVFVTEDALESYFAYDDMGNYFT